MQWKGSSDPHELVWSNFRRAILSSNLVDPAGFQTLIDQHRSLSQGQRSILDYVRFATTLRQKAFSHRFLAHYPEFFFVEAFHAGLTKDLQSRIIVVSGIHRFVIPEDGHLQGRPASAPFQGAPASASRHTF
jgi:hypothetical protein